MVYRSKAYKAVYSAFCLAGQFFQPGNTGSNPVGAISSLVTRISSFAIRKSWLDLLMINSFLIASRPKLR